MRFIRTSTLPIISSFAQGSLKSANPFSVKSTSADLGHRTKKGKTVITEPSWNQRGGEEKYSHPSLAAAEEEAAMAHGLPSSPCGLLTADAARSLVDSVDAFLFDCDGVIWRGDTLIEGVPETMELLRKMGKKLVFVTNNSRKSRRQYSKKFRTLGLEVSEEEISASSFAAAIFLKLNNFPPEKKVYVVGEDGILEDLRLAGFECFIGPEDGKTNILLEANFYFEHDKSWSCCCWA